MKKILYLLFVAIMLFGLTACNKSASVSDTIEAETIPILTEATTGSVYQQLSYSLYIPNSNADGFDIEIIRTDDISAETVLTELIYRNILPDTVAINSFKMDNRMITIDFNQAFADVVCSMGTSGEFMIVGSVINTFLDAFQAESVYFTVDGQVLESGHTIYDFAMTYF